MKHRAFTRVQLLIGASAIAVVAAVGLPFFWKVRDNLRRASCAASLKQIGLGWSQYTQDNDKRFPLTTTREGWVESLQIYVKSDAIFHCPSENEWGGENLTDFWFNRRLAGVSTDDVANPALTLLSGDGEASDDPNSSLALMPPLWVSKADSPARRHLGTGNYLFVDGHATMLRPEQITADKPSKNAPTFLLGP